MGAVAGLSPKLGFASAIEPRGNPQPQADVEIPVVLVQIKSKGNAKKNVLVCPDVAAKKSDSVLWFDAGGNVGNVTLDILLVQFKGGRTPFADTDLPTPMAANAVSNTADKGRYSYLIVARASDNKTYALDPDLDII
jgi:hypothetical protein